LPRRLHPETVATPRWARSRGTDVRKFAEISNETGRRALHAARSHPADGHLFVIEDERRSDQTSVVRSLYDPPPARGHAVGRGEHCRVNPVARLVMYGQELNADRTRSARPTC